MTRPRESQYRPWSRQWTPATDETPAAETEATEATGDGEAEATTRASTQTEDDPWSRWYGWQNPTGWNRADGPGTALVDRAGTIT